MISKRADRQRREGGREGKVMELSENGSKKPFPNEDLQA